MIKKSLQKNIFRDIRSTFSRFIAIFAITALGAGCFAGLRSTGPDMLITADQYYLDQRLADYRLLSTMGFTEEDIEALREREGVQDVMAGYGMDLLVDVGNETVAMRLNALPEDMSDDNPDYLNRLVLMEGRYPENANECVADTAEGFHKIGDVLTLSASNDSDSLDRMKQKEFTVVGLVRSPSYISFQRGNTNIGNGRITSFAYLPPEAFDREFYTDVYLRTGLTDELSSYSDEYEQATENGVESLEALGEERARIRYDDIYNEASAELADARAELADARAEADEELADALAALEDGEAQLAEGRREITENQRKLDDARVQLAEGESQMASGRAALASAQAQLDAGRTEYQSQLAVYEQNYALVAAQRTQYDTASAQLDGLYGAISGIEGAAGSLAALRPTIGANTTPEEQAAAAAFLQGASGAAGALRQMADGMSAGGMGAAAAPLYNAAGGVDAALAVNDYDTALAILSGVGGQVRPALDAARAQLDAGLPQLQAAEAQLAAAKTELDAALATINQGQAQIDAGWAEIAANEQLLADARIEIADGQQQLNDARIEIADAERELADGWEEYNSGKAEADEKFADAEQEIADGQRELDDLEPPTWYVWDRSNNPGYSGFSSDAHRIDSISLVFPFFFFLVALLVSLTTMTRMVEEQRVQIGTLKALGFSKGSIAFKYILYAAAASITGSIAGVLLCSVVFPTAIWSAYQMMYIMPAISTPPDPFLTLVSVGGAVACTTLATVLACYAELKSPPAELMRPKAPRPGKRILLERIKPLWRHMGFSQKVTARNLFRYKKRFFMTVIGVAGCTALLLTGFGLRDSITGIAAAQFGNINLYNIAASLTDSSSVEAVSELNQVAAGYGDFLYTEQQNLNARSGKLDNTGMTTYLYVAEDPARLPEFINFHDRESGEAIAFPQGDGVVVTEKLAKKLGVPLGGTMELWLPDGEPVTVTVAGITENYIYNYVYVTPQLYQSLFGEAPEYNTLLLRLNEGLDVPEDEVLTNIVKTDGVAGAIDVGVMRDSFDDMLEGIAAVVWLIIFAAGALAFVVLYNLTNINITERSREIATLKVLGFYPGEVASYVYRENLLLTAIGILGGFVAGIYLHQFVITVAEIDEVMFRRVVMPQSFLWAALLTLASAIFVNLVMLRRLKKIDMVESLKSAE